MFQIMKSELNFLVQKAVQKIKKIKTKFLKNKKNKKK